MSTQANFFDSVPNTYPPADYLADMLVEVDWLRRWCQDVATFGDWLENRIHDWNWS